MNAIIQPTGRFRGQEVIDKARKFLEPEELSRLFAAARIDPFWYGYFRVEYYFGCRLSEVALILKEDVSFNENKIIIRRLKKRKHERIKTPEGKWVYDKSVPPGTGFTEDVYDLAPNLAKVIRRVIETGYPKNPWLFGSHPEPLRATTKKPQDRLALLRRTTADGAEWRAVHRDTAHAHFAEVAQTANLPERLRHSHVLRHTRATLMLADGARVEDVLQLLGHSSTAITERYLGQAKALRMRVATTAQLGDVLDGET